jgi:isoleucyl-tRNA synthetase
MKKMFKPVEPKPDFPKLEKKILEWWHQTGLVEKYLQKNKTAKKKFSFFDGPITANNPMGVHHAWGRTYKDLWQRFKNMQGFCQRFQNGFDNQGLWVEVEVEKELGFKDKKEIEKYGIEKFVEKCKERTLKFAGIQTEQSKRLGYFMDWDHSYYTLSDENNYMIWHFLKECWQDGNLYKGRDSVPWCPRCGTAISQHEILTEEYQELTHDSIYFKLPIKGEKNQAFLVWTTTPWTLPANVALAVNQEFIYGEYKKKSGKESLIMLKELKHKILDKSWLLIKEYPGEALKGWQYQGPFDDLPRVKEAQKENPKTFHTVVLDKDLVTATEGTGIVHIAPGAGQEDFQLGKKENLSVLAVIDEEADYLEGLEELSGKNAKKDPGLIFTILKEKEQGRYFFKIEPYLHRYPVCWRCQTELVWRVVDEWYLAMDNKIHPKSKDYRSRMMKVAKKINWLPSWGLERELDWLVNMQDWLISKKRYWGLALPIWECSCGHFEVIGSKKELKEKAVSGWQEFEGQSPHRPWIDKVKIKCPACGNTATRITDVGNPWLDAGIISFSTLVDPKTGEVSYLTDKNYWREWFPADFITESFPGQFKNWFYSLLAMATVLEDTPPYKTVLGFATLLAEDGRPMHKSLGNAIEFSEGADKIGVDVMRWIYVRQNPADNLLFGYHKADEVRRRFHLMLWNIYNFFVTYALIDGWKPKGNRQYAISSTHDLDRWILLRLNQLILTVTQSLEKYDAFTASHAIEDFVNDLSTWYVRRSRDRVGPTAAGGEDKNACYQTLYEVLVTLTKILAPFMPFLAEEIFKNLTGKDSVHLEDWLEVEEGLIDKELEEEMVLVRKICELGHAARKEAGIRVRQPLSSIKVQVSSIKLEEELLQLIKDELNVKEVIWEKKAVKEPQVELETKLTSQLKAEGEAREIVRQIQDLRKKQGCRLDEKIMVTLPSWPKEFEEEIKKQTLAKKLVKGKELTINS